MTSGITETTSSTAEVREYLRAGRRAALIAVMLVSIAGSDAGAAEPLKAPATETADAGPEGGVAAGRQRFERNCAICHGFDARGNGPFAELLNVKPPDLTLLSRAQGGDFPFTRVYRRIDGRDLPLAHGTRDMPIWGARLKREGGDETWVRGRIFEIMLYLESLQQL